MSGDIQVLPLIQQIRSMGIGVDKLLQFSLLVDEKAQTFNLPISAAAYRVIEDIENYNRIGRLATEIYTSRNNPRCAAFVSRGAFPRWVGGFTIFAGI